MAINFTKIFDSKIDKLLRKRNCGRKRPYQITKFDSKTSTGGE